MLEDKASKLFEIGEKWLFSFLDMILLFALRMDRFLERVVKSGS